jgi:ring-1,2-phenylacetyl-CoA epoxidase subunit PaaA
MTEGTAEQKAMVQDGLNRWWWPTLMMFGPHDKESPNSAVLMRWGIKTKSNDELRQEFINEEVPPLQALGIEIPDPDLKFNQETGNWEIGLIDWDEFWQVVRGHGPMNEERLAARQKAHDDGLWVRQAMEAYAKRNYVIT